MRNNEIAGNNEISKNQDVFRLRNYIEIFCNFYSKPKIIFAELLHYFAQKGRDFNFGTWNIFPYMFMHLRLVLIYLRSFNGHHGQWFDKENTQVQGCCMKLKKLLGNFVTRLLIVSFLNPITSHPSKELIKCRILHFLIMESCRYFVFF